jgi:hypothetical protein
MDMAGIQNGAVGMALFDQWMASVKKNQANQKTKGSPLVAAAAAAFENYIQTEETGMAAQIASVATYALNPDGNSASGISAQQMAPFLALYVMA